MRWLFIPAAVGLCCLPCLGAEAADQPGRVYIGEKLDPAGYGAGVIEPMDVVLAREEARLAEAEQNLKDRGGEQGVWAVPSRGATGYVTSGEHNLVNKWGDPCMGFSFPTRVDVKGAYFAGQGGRGVWTTAVRVLGYRDGAEVQLTDWFNDLGAGAAWFEMDLRNVDRIVIQAVPALDRRGWYALDDLTYTPVAEPGQPQPATVVIDFEDCQYGQKLTGTDYAGLTWESAAGGFDDAEAVHAPLVPPGREKETSAGTESEGGEGLRTGGTLPALLQSFIGVKKGDASQTAYPPDTCGAIGPNHFLEVVNRVIAAYNRTTGARVWISALGSFLPGSNGDPRILYDQHSGRWIVMVDDFNTRLYLAVSLTSDPTGSWFKTSFVVSQGSDAGKWPDYPTMGVDAVGVYMAAYMVGGGMSIFAVDKAPLIAPSPSLGTVTAFRNLPWEGAIQPVHTYGNPGREYFISRKSLNSLRVRRLVGPLTAPTLTEMGSVSIPLGSDPSDVPALGSTVDLDSVDGRLMNAVYRDGSIWTCHTINVSDRAACRWYEIRVVGSPSLVQYGTVADSIQHYFFPGISVNARGDAVMGFTGSNASEYASAYYTGRLYSDPPGVMAVPAPYKAGQASQNNIDGYGRNRWGDYSLSTLDPTDQVTLWTIQEYAEATDIWGTYIAKLRLNSDCNGNGVDDLTDLSAGTSADCNTNRIPDDCEPNQDCNYNGVQDICDVGRGTSLDCNLNRVPDECEVDCNSNGIPDACDVGSGTSADCQGNSTPDECEPDCNQNGMPDECDIIAGTSLDCNLNGIPDNCDLAGGTSFDCTGNGIPDDCETDCNKNGIRDDCDIASGTSRDCTANGIPDECEFDCNSNGVRDDCDVAAGTAHDCNLNGIPDQCDVEQCHYSWNGFQGLAYQLPMHGLDIDGDGTAWANPADTGKIWVYGCEFEGTADRSVQVTVTTDPPEDGYVVSEYFQSDNGALPPNAQLTELRFQPRLEGYLNPKTDWQLFIYDATNDQAALAIEFISTVSTRVPADQRGKILVRNPSGSPAFINTGVTIAVSHCYDFRVTLNRLTGTVQLSIDGAATLVPPLAVLQSGAGRLDYFRAQAVSNGALSGGTTGLKLDAFTLCLTGGKTFPPALWDCNGNGVLDECDLSAGTSRDCNTNGLPDECEVGDFNGDGTVDLTDYVTFVGCINGPGGGTLVGGCVCADYDGDGDVDVADFAAFQKAFTVP
jgi:hypothetical protein